jgi:hypothetical protein
MPTLSAPSLRRASTSRLDHSDIELQGLRVFEHPEPSLALALLSDCAWLSRRSRCDFFGTGVLPEVAPSPLA